MPLFDLNVTLGRTALPAGAPFDTPGDLLEEMRRLRIDEALVCHAIALEADAEYGNALLIEQLRGHQNLFPCWVMAPPAFGDLPEPKGWVERARSAGVRAVRFTPKHGHYSLGAWCTGPLLNQLEQAGMPVLLDFGEHHWSQSPIPWNDVLDICRRFPSLDVALIGVSVGDTRNLYAALRTAPNLNLECHAFVLPDAYQLMAREGLAGRILFGTGMPQCAGENRVFQLCRSGLTQAEQTAASWHNAHRLLRINSHPATDLLRRDPANWPKGVVIDVHAHYGSWETTSSPVSRPEDIVNSMHRCAVHKVVGSSFTAIHGETRLGNEQTAHIIRKYLDFLYGYCVINPNYPQDTAGEIERCFEKAVNFVGLKFHCGLHGKPLHDAGYSEALEYANEHALPVLVHAHGEDDWKGTTQRYPNVPFIVAHACTWNTWSPPPDMISLAGVIDNLYLDVAGSAAWRKALQRLAKQVGLRKVLYGSDYPMFDFAFEVGRIALGDLSDVEKLTLCGGNAARLFTRLV
ncbi:MAG TPA: amidohydrolase family protein [Candidatus Hydrogenedentes bacterium]|nr:amidohydrolase family protein [Candidatus Hydrogenedentota bacterium]HQM48748.1 amidohydrolase family protein [Candidatus Hydrogenedentota bacterium]